MKGTRITPQLLIWAAFAAFTALVLIVNAVQALFGTTALAWWHYPTLGIALLFVWMELPARRRARVIIKARQTSIQAAKHILSIFRTARGLAVLNAKIKTGI